MRRGRPDRAPSARRRPHGRRPAGPDRRHPGSRASRAQRRTTAARRSRSHGADRDQDERNEAHHVAMTPDVVACCPAPFYDPFATLAWLRQGADYSIRGEFNAMPRPIARHFTRPSQHGVASSGRDCPGHLRRTAAELQVRVERPALNNLILPGRQILYRALASTVLLVHGAPPSELPDTLHNAANGLADALDDATEEASLHVGSRSVGKREIPDTALGGPIAVTALLFHDVPPCSRSLVIGRDSTLPAQPRRLLATAFSISWRMFARFERMPPLTAFVSRGVRSFTAGLRWLRFFFSMASLLGTRCRSRVAYGMPDGRRGIRRSSRGGDERARALRHRVNLGQGAMPEASPTLCRGLPRRPRRGESGNIADFAGLWSRGAGRSGRLSGCARRRPSSRGAGCRRRRA